MTGTIYNSGTVIDVFGSGSINATSYNEGSGSMFNSSRTIYAFAAEPAPEPATGLLIGASVVAVAARRRCGIWA